MGIPFSFALFTVTFKRIVRNIPFFLFYLISL